MNWESLRCTKGGKITVHAWNKLIEACRRAQVTSVVGGRLIEGEGAQIIIPPRGSAPAAPWNATVRPGASGSLRNVTINPGYINGHAPTMDVSGTPTPINTSPAPHVVIDATGAQVVYLKLKLPLNVMNNYVYSADFASAEILAGAAVPADDLAAGEYYQLLADFADGKKTPQPVLVNLGFCVSDSGLGDSSASCDLYER